MTLETFPEYNTITSAFKSDNLPVTPAEMQGLLSGMLCGGLNLERDAWTQMLYDYTNDAITWPVQSNTLAKSCMNVVSSQLSADKTHIHLLLPDKTASLSARAQALSEWINAYICGIGLVMQHSHPLSKKSTEIIAELIEIAQLSIEENNDKKEQGSHLKLIIEHVQHNVIALYVELNPRS